MTTSFPITISSEGHETKRHEGYATEKVERVGRYAHRPIIRARVRLREGHNPSHERPANAQATLSLPGETVRAEASAATMREAIDELEDRLRRQLEHLSGKDGPHRGGIPA